MHDCRLRADTLFIRAQSAIRADGTPAAQVRSLQFDVLPRVRRWGRTIIARSRAPTAFTVRMKSASVR